MSFQYFHVYYSCLQICAYIVTSLPDCYTLWKNIYVCTHEGVFVIVLKFLKKKKKKILSGHSPYRNSKALQTVFRFS